MLGVVQHLQLNQPITIYSKKSKGRPATSFSRTFLHKLSSKSSKSSTNSTKLAEKTETESSSSSTLKSSATLVQNIRALPKAQAREEVVSNDCRDMILQSLGLDQSSQHRSILKNGSIATTTLSQDLIRFARISQIKQMKVKFASPLISASNSLEDYYMLQTVRKVHDLAAVESDSSHVSAEDSHRISVDSVYLENEPSNKIPRHKESIEDFGAQEMEIAQGLEEIETEDIPSFDEGFLLEGCESDPEEDDEIPLAHLLAKADYTHSSNLGGVRVPSPTKELGSQNMQNVIGKLRRTQNFVRKDPITESSTAFEIREMKSGYQSDSADSVDSLDFSSPSRKSSIELFEVDPILINSRTSSPSSCYNSPRSSLQVTTLERPHRDSITILNDDSASVSSSSSSKSNDSLPSNAAWVKRSRDLPPRARPVLVQQRKFFSNLFK